MFQVIIFDIAPGNANIFTHPVTLPGKTESDPPVQGLQITISAETPDIRMTRMRALLPDGTPDPNAPAEIRARIAPDSDTIIIEPNEPPPTPPVLLSAGVDEFAGAPPVLEVEPVKPERDKSAPLTPEEITALMKSSEKK